ncbi:MAG: MCE family protein [Deltaproteobacteria bacterium]|nr:MCE family protein [Deltaproteobacteria bacterium]
MKVGLFALGAILIIVFATLRVSDRNVFRGGEYDVLVVLDSASGLTKKTPVEVAGIQVGYIDSLELFEGDKARANLRLSKNVKLGKDAIAQVRSKGFLGETYVELLPGHLESGVIPQGGQIQATNPYADLGQIASDVREITSSIKSMLSKEEGGPLFRVLDNMEVFTKKLSELTVQNQEEINQIVANFKNFSSSLDEVISERKESLKDTMERLNKITRKVDEGHGTLGKLVNDEETADNINDAARGLSETLGGVNRFQINFDAHTEFAGPTKEFKSYVGLELKPRPDKYFIIDFIVDPSPSPTETITESKVTTGGTTTTVTTDRNITHKDTFLLSAELAKNFYNFTIRGGLIESRGGVGLDYHLGPFTTEFSAFDFRTSNDQRPHLKLMEVVNLSKNFFLVTGLDDPLSKRQDLNWFVGGGLRLVDNDMKTLVGAASLKK